VIAHLRRLPLYAAVLLEEIPTLISVTRQRVCELDGGHEWGDWRLLEPLIVVRECRNCGAGQATGYRSVASPQAFSVPLNMN
jgi:hypothetical protein